MLKAAVIGCGNISQYHFSGLDKAGVAIHTVCDLDEGAARPWKEKFGAAYTADYRSAVADPSVDIVDITCATRAHREIALAAIAAGKAVIVEKTLGETAAEAAEIVRAATAAGTILYTAYMKRFLPAVVRARELLPDIGSLLAAEFRTLQGWGCPLEDTPPAGIFLPENGRPSWVKRSYGGGILWCGGSHILDLVNFFTGRARSVFALMKSAPGYDIDLAATLLLDAPECAVRVLALAHPLKRIGFTARPWDEGFKLIGTRGTLEVDSPDWTDHTVNGSRLRHYDNATASEVEYRFDPVSPFDRELAFFAAQIASGEQGPQSRATGYEVDQLIESAAESARTGQAVVIPWQV